MWTVGLTVEIKLCFHDAPFRDGLVSMVVSMVGLTVEIKLRFRDVEIELRCRDGLVWTVGVTV